MSFHRTPRSSHQQIPYIKRCIKTWKKHLKGYEIKEWNESNFDVFSHPFVKKAYEAKKWAFVSDYIRAYAIYHEGGIYLDTDVIVLKPFDPMLENKAFVGYEREDYPFTAVFGAEPHHSFVKDILDYFNDKTILYISHKNVSDLFNKFYHLYIVLFVIHYHHLGQLHNS